MKSFLQTLCIITVAIGIAYEAHYQASLGFVLITVGSLAFAISTKINDRKKREGR